MNQEADYSFTIADPRQTQMLVRAMRAEIQLLRYWMLQTLRNYKQWHRIAPVQPAYPAKNIVHTSRAVRGIVARSFREYRRKQALLGNLIRKQRYFSAVEIHYYRIENHFGAATAAAFANDNNN